MSSILIAKQLASRTSNFNVDSSTHIPPITLVSNGLAGVESVAINVSDDNGATFAPLMDHTTGTAVVLDATHNAVSIGSPGKYQIVKPITGGLVGVSLSTLTTA